MGYAEKEKTIVDILCHSVMGFHLGYYTTNRIEVGIAFGLLSAVPDLWNPESIIKSDNWDFKNKIENGKHWLKWLPPIALHIAIDKLGHGEGNEWYKAKWYEYFIPSRYKAGMWTETLGWIINILLTLKIFLW